ncbi:MAG TPA: type II CAAX endopeptidase family protein [Vicinamibacterales bacterium]|nr:type II CAAX endopeptidase family protein [Vicinamibacterales bacterium]
MTFDERLTTPDASGPTRAAPSIADRATALIEVLVCSDYPTQFALATLFGALGFRPFDAHGTLQVGYVVWLSLLDACLLVGLIVALLAAHGERPSEVFFGGRPAARELSTGVPMIVIALGLGIAVLAPIQHFAPWLHTVPHNPLEALMRSPRNALLFAGVVIVAGGIREEVQRAFILHRFEQSLGGGAIGVVLSSAAFGAGHLLQGADAAIATGVLGAFWGIVYLRRRSILAPMVSHAGFDLLQIAQALAMGY